MRRLQAPAPELQDKVRDEQGAGKRIDCLKIAIENHVRSACTCTSLEQVSFQHNCHDMHKQIDNHTSVYTHWSTWNFVPMKYMWIIYGSQLQPPQSSNAVLSDASGSKKTSMLCSIPGCIPLTTYLTCLPMRVPDKTDPIQWHRDSRHAQKENDTKSREFPAA